MAVGKAKPRQVVKPKPKPAPKTKQAPKPKKVAIGGKLKPKKSTGRKAYS